MRYRSLKIEKSYFNTGKEEFNWSYEKDGKKRKIKCYIVRRKISDIINTLIECRFTVKKIDEPKPDKRYLSKEDQSYGFQYSIIKMVPSTIIFKARKD